MTVADLEGGGGVTGVTTPPLCLNFWPFCGLQLLDPFLGGKGTNFSGNPSNLVDFSLKQKVILLSSHPPPLLGWKR